MQNLNNRSKYWLSKYIIVSVIYLLVILACEPINENHNIEGVWQCSETSSAYGEQNFEVEIESIDESKSRILDFANLKINIEITTTNDIIDIPQQVINDNTTTFTIYGEGEIISKSKIELSYTIDNETFTADLTKAK